MHNLNKGIKREELTIIVEIQEVVYNTFMSFDDKNTVVLITGHDRREMVREALTVLGDVFAEKIKSAKKIFIHPNLVNYRKQAACTHVEAVRGIVDHIALARGDEILVGDAGYHDTKKAFEAFDYQSLARSGNVRLVDLNDDETIESYAYTADFKKRTVGFSKTVAESDCNIVVVPAKMHSYCIVSLSIKTHVVGSEVVARSPFGIHARWPWLHTGYPAAHRTLADVYAKHPAQLAIIDGTQAMEGNGPASGDTVDLGWVIVSCNPVAADALAAYLMGLEPSEIGYLFSLDQKGLGPIDPKEISLTSIGSQTPPFRRIEGLRRDLKRPDSYPGILAWRAGVQDGRGQKLSHRARHFVAKFR